jgi:hypothetical protein
VLSKPSIDVCALTDVTFAINLVCDFVDTYHLLSP